jgi:hypothetical protein
LGATDLSHGRAREDLTSSGSPGRFLVGWRPNSRDAKVASVRIRCLNPLRELRRRGYPVELFDPARSAAYSVVIYSKVYDERIQAEARRLQSNGTRIVLDLCDNHFYTPLNLDAPRNAAAQLRRMVGLADELVASTDAMAQVLREEAGPDRHVSVIGDAVETAIEGVPAAPWERWWARRRLQALSKRLEGGADRARLVWFGSHGGPAGDHGMGDLESLRPLLESLHREHAVSLTVISNSAAKFARLIRSWSLPTHYLEWSAETFLDALRLHAIALIPIRENPFTRCKTNNRLVTALAAGLGVAATGIPSYRPFEEFCVLDDWSDGLRRYILDPEARRRAVTAGQRLLEREWTLARIADRWQQYFDGFRVQGSRR